MKALFKTFLLMMIFGGVALLISTVLLHTPIFSKTLKFSQYWVIWRGLIYLSVIVFRNKLIRLFANHHKVDYEVFNNIFPSRRILILFFVLFELLIIQSGLAYLVAQLIRWFS